MALCFIVLLIVGTTMLLNSSRVQQWISVALATELENRIGTRVNLGKVHWLFPNDIVIDSLEIDDQEGEHLLAVNRIAAKVEWMPLIKNRQISIRNIRVFYPDIIVYKDNEEAEHNYQFLIDAFASKKEKKPSKLNLRINSLLVRHANFRYDIHSVPDSINRFSPSHIQVEDLSTHISLKAFTNDTISIMVRELNFAEKSGLQVDNLYFRLVGNHHGATLANFHLKLPHTAIKLDTIWTSYMPDRFTESLIVKGGIQPSYITPRDLRFIIPEAKTLRERIFINADFIGSLDRFNLKDITIHTENNGLRLEASGTSYQRGNDNDATDFYLKKAILTPNMWPLLEAQLPVLYKAIPEEIVRIGKIDAKGNIHLSKQESRINLQAKTGAGDLKAQVNIDQTGKYTSSLEGKRINVAQIIPTSPLSQTDIKLLTQGKYDNNIHDDGLPFRGTFHGEATYTGFLGYEYQNISFDGQYAPAVYKGNIQITGPNGCLELQAAYNDTKPAPHLTVNLVADSLNLHAMNLIKSHEGRTFSANLNSDLRGPDIDHIVGKIGINDLTMHNENDDYIIHNITLNSTDSSEKFIAFNSDFMEASIRGDFTYQSLVNCLSAHFQQSFPSLNKGSITLSDTHTEDICALHLRIRDVSPLSELFLLPISIEHAIEIEAGLHYNKEFTFNLNAEHLRYGEHDLNHISLNCNSDSEGMLIQVGGTKQGQDGVDIIANITANAANDRISLGGAWNSNPTALFDGSFHTIAQISHTDNDELSVQIKSDSTTTTINRSKWILHPFDINISPQNYSIRNFRFEHNASQYLDINGSIADNITDTLSVKLNNMDLNYLLSLVKLKGISFGGQLSGEINAAGLYSEAPYLNADILAKDFTFCEGEMGDAQVYAQWDQDTSRLEFTADLTENRKHTTHIDGTVDIPKNELWLDIDADSTDVSFLNKMLGSFIDEISGNACGHILVGGKMDAIDLSGALFADANLRLIPTNTHYKLSDTIRFTPGVIHFDNISAYDHHNQKAIINGAVKHDKLDDYAYDLRINAQNVLGIDLPDTGSDSFYTTIHGTGDIHVSGGPGLPLSINIVARPERGSLFALNLINQDVTSSESFIVFRDRASKRNTPTEDLTQQTRQQRQITSSATPLELNITADVTQDAKLKLVMNQAADDHISVTGNGDLRININDDDIKLHGTYTINHGAYNLSLQDVINKNFDVLEGSTVTFDGDPMKARLNITARHTVNYVPLKDLSPEITGNVQVNCLLYINGTLNEPVIAFGVELPKGTEEEKAILRSYTSTEEQKNIQFIYLLGLGKFYTQDMAQNPEANSNMESFLSSTISGQINNILSNIIHNEKWNLASNIRTDRMLGETTETWENMEIEGILEGRLLNNRLLINGNFGYRDNPMYASNFIGDFDIQYLIRNGISLKGYSKTNDRYFSKTSLTTQGIGLVFQRDFNNIFSRNSIFLNGKN